MRSFKDNTVEPFTLYSYKIESYNNKGSTISKPAFITIKLPSYPCCRFEFKVSNIRAKLLEIKWRPPKKLNGFDTLYFIETYRQINKSQPITKNNLIKLDNSSDIADLNGLVPFNGFFKYTIKNLEPYKQYLVSIKACNKDLTLDLYYCLNGKFFITVFRYLR